MRWGSQLVVWGSGLMQMHKQKFMCSCSFSLNFSVATLKFHSPTSSKYILNKSSAMLVVTNFLTLARVYVIGIHEFTTH